MRITLKDRLLHTKAMVEDTGKALLSLQESFGNEDMVFFDLTDEELALCQGRVSISIDKNLQPAKIYMPKGKLMYQIPSGWKSKAYDDEAFKGPIRISMELCSDGDKKERRNLALNSMDVRGETVDYFPHADANVVTRDEPWFEARNAIDGIINTKGHGPYPYHSWGGGLREDLEFRLYFGRPVIIDEVVLHLRADYVDDHDINWENARIEFSDGTELQMKLKKTTDGQSFPFEPKEIQWLKLNNLEREISAAFSALTQIEVYGHEVEGTKATGIA